MSDSATRLVVIGGGISGLSAAQAAHELFVKAAHPSQVVLLEKEAELGGKARSVRQGDWLVEEGPNGFLDDDGALSGRARAAGLIPEGAREAAARRFLYLNGKLREIRPHPWHFVRSGILGPSGLLRAFQEPWRKPGTANEESVWEFAARRLGRQAADRLVSAMVLGVYAGDAKRLSVQAAFPKLAALEEQHGSLIRGMIAKRKARGEKGASVGPSGKLTSFSQGMQSLPKALGQQANFTVQCNAVVTHLERLGDGFGITLANGDTLTADAVILAAEGWAQAPLLSATLPEAASLLEGVPCPPVTVVALGYGPTALPKVPRGFGALIPRGQGFRMLGCLWENHLFLSRAPEGHLLVRVMVGGAVDPEIGGLDEEQSMAMVEKELAQLFHWEESPVFRHVKRWKKAIPQYELGHLDRVRRIQELLADVPGLFLAGNALHGVAFPRAAATGRQVGEQAAKFLSTLAVS